MTIIVTEYQMFSAFSVCYLRFRENMTDDSPLHPICQCQSPGYGRRQSYSHRAAHCDDSQCVQATPCGATCIVARDVHTYEIHPHGGQSRLRSERYRHGADTCV